MNHDPPPPPPPHGEGPKSSGLPPGNYDIFIIPPHSSGSGFLYLPSLRPNVNSFAAGFATALVLVAICSAMAPAVQAWWHSIKGAGGMGMIMVVLGIAVGAWALGRTQSDGGPGPGGGGAGPQAHANQHTHTPPRSNGGPPPPQSNQGSYHAPPPPHSGSYHAPPPDHGAHPGTQQHSYQAPPPPPPPPPPTPPPEPEATPRPEPEKPKSTWQRSTPKPGAAGPAPSTPLSAWERAREETKKREAERKAAEAAKQRKEEVEKKLKELREKDAREREAREARLRQATERRAAEKKAAEQLANEKKEDARREAESKAASSTYAFSSVGEKMNPWPRGRPTTPTEPSPPNPRPRSVTPPPRAAPPSPQRKPPPPTARTYLGTDDDTHSFRPYDKPRRPTHKKSQSSIYSESSYAASQSTARTTPPASHRMPYSTKDPDKIVIKAVYSFTNSFLKTPTSQLVSGAGSVTDGLILRITTEGLFIDDDVRGVPQREWDVKAWTMKLVETGENKAAGLHVLRASIRDTEGKRYVFILTAEESWKVAVGLQRLRKGSQVRALGVSGMSSGDARSTLEDLGW